MQARMLVEYLCMMVSDLGSDMHSKYSGKRVVELGAGTGLVGLALASGGWNQHLRFNR